MDKKYIINLQGKDFVVHEGLLDEFHQNKGNFISTELIRTPDQATGMWIFRATVEGEKGKFSAYGDASSANVNSMIMKHVMRMAETRAINRALRLYNNIGMCSAEELGGEEQPPKPSILAPQKSQTIQNTTPTPNTPKNETVSPVKESDVIDIFSINCDLCSGQLKLIPEGISKRTGNHYDAFYGCSNRDCKRSVPADQIENYIRAHEDKVAPPVPTPPPFENEIEKEDLPF